MDPVVRAPGTAQGTDPKRSYDAATASDSVSHTNNIKPQLSPVSNTSPHPQPQAKPKSRRRGKQASAEEDDAAKRRCVSTACIACRKRKSKCDGNTPACAACSQVYGTECIYDPNSDHRRKGVYKSDSDHLKTRSSTLQTLIHAILNYPEDEVPALVREIRTCESLDEVADRIVAKEQGLEAEEDDGDVFDTTNNGANLASNFETQLFGKMGDLRLDEGTVRYIGGTSNLIHLGNDDYGPTDADDYSQQEDPITSWTTVTDDPELVVHLLNMYFTWHYTYFTTLSKSLFYRDFLLGRPPPNAKRKTYYCTPLLVNAILALGCHFTSHTGARAVAEDSATAGDHFFKEAKRLIMENDEHEKPRLTTVQALALMSVREAGCGREAKGWVYSGMSFRMALDMGLNLNSGQLTKNKNSSPDEAEEDVRRITFWGCFLFDKCWSNYLGRLPQLPTSLITVPKVEVFPDEDSSQWSPYSDSGFAQANQQPSRTRAVALQITKLCEISNDLMRYFYNPTDIEKTKGKQAELKKLSEIHTRLEAWRRELPKELEPKEGGLASVLVMHMFFQLLFVHLFRPFLKYTQATSPLPQSVSPRKLCTQAAGMISKLLRLYKRSHGLRQICNIAVYIAHSACTIHLLNLPDKNARRDIIHGVKHLEEIAEGWLCARRALGVLSVVARKWKVELPEDAATVLARTDAKFGSFHSDMPSPPAQLRASQSEMHPSQFTPQQQQSWHNSPANLMSTPAHPFNTTVSAAPEATPAVLTNSGSAAVRSNSLPDGIYSSPPNDAFGLQALQYPSNATTPAAAPRHASRNSITAQRSDGASPSDMFGGVDQLIRDSSDWVYRDQQQFATGFENWNAMELDPAHWAQPSAGTTINSLPANVPLTNGYVRATTMPAPAAGTAAFGSRASFGMANASGGSDPTPSGYPSMNGMQHMHQPFNGDLASYNEEEWYQ